MGSIFKNLAKKKKKKKKKNLAIYVLLECFPGGSVVRIH